MGREAMPSSSYISLEATAVCSPYFGTLALQPPPISITMPIPKGCYRVSLGLCAAAFLHLLQLGSPPGGLSSTSEVPMCLGQASA